MKFKGYLKTIVLPTLVISGLLFKSQLHASIPLSPEDADVIDVRDFSKKPYRTVSPAVLDLLAPGEPNVQRSFNCSLFDMFEKVSYDATLLATIKAYVENFFTEGDAIAKLRTLISDTQISWLKYGLQKNGARKQLIPAPAAIDRLKVSTTTPLGTEVEAIWGEKSSVIHYLLIDVFLYSFVSFSGGIYSTSANMKKLLSSSLDAFKNRKALVAIIKDSITKERGNQPADPFVATSYWSELETWFGSQCALTAPSVPKKISASVFASPLGTAALGVSDGNISVRTGCKDAWLRVPAHIALVGLLLLGLLYVTDHVADQEDLDHQSMTLKEFSGFGGTIVLACTAVSLVWWLMKKCCSCQQRRHDANPAQ